MPATTGTDFLIKVNTGTVGVPIWTTVGGQRSGTLNMGADEADFTSKDSSGWHEGEPVIRNWSVDFDALLIEGDAGLVALEDAYMDNEKVQVQVAMPSGKVYSGYATLSDFSYEGPYDSESTASGSLTGSGELAPTGTAKSTGLTTPFFVISQSAVVTPVKAGDVFDYIATVLTGVTSVTVTPTAAAGDITVNGNVVATGVASSAITLGAAGTNTTIQIVVTETDKQPKTYTIRVARAAL